MSVGKWAFPTLILEGSGPMDRSGRGVRGGAWDPIPLRETLNTDEKMRPRNREGAMAKKPARRPQAARKATPPPRRKTSKRPAPRRPAPAKGVKQEPRVAPPAPSKPPEPPLSPPPLRDGPDHLLSLSFLRDGDEFFARLETSSGQITELKNRSLDQLLTLVAGELEDLLE